AQDSLRPTRPHARTQSVARSSRSNSSRLRRSKRLTVSCPRKEFSYIKFIIFNVLRYLLETDSHARYSPSRGDDVDVGLGDNTQGATSEAPLAPARPQPSARRRGEPSAVDEGLEGRAALGPLRGDRRLHPRHRLPGEWPLSNHPQTHRSVHA